MRVHFTRDLFGYVAFSFIVAYWAYGTLIPLKIIIIPYYQMGVMRWHAILMYGFLSVMTIASLLRSTFSHPGRVPTNTDSIDDPEWTFCDKCNIKRPPRAHHCRRCGHCVTRLDHHCPWINNCVGEDNHFAFMQLIFYTTGLSISAFVFCLSKSYKLPPCPETFCPPDDFFTKHTHGLLVSMYVISIVMAVAILGLSCGQHFTIALDITTLESLMSGYNTDLMFSKPMRPVMYRYSELCGTSNILLWLLPCRRRCVQKYRDFSNHIV